MVSGVLAASIIDDSLEPRIRPHKVTVHVKHAVVHQDSKPASEQRLYRPSPNANPSCVGTDMPTRVFNRLNESIQMVRGTSLKNVATYTITYTLITFTMPMHMRIHMSQHVSLHVYPLTKLTSNTAGHTRPPSQSPNIINSTGPGTIHNTGPGIINNTGPGIINSAGPGVISSIKHPQSRRSIIGVDVPR